MRGKMSHQKHSRRCEKKKEKERSRYMNGDERAREKEVMKLSIKEIPRAGVSDLHQRV